MDCPTCGEPLLDGARFCEACGADLPTAPPPAPATDDEAADSTVEFDVRSDLRSHQMKFPAPDGASGGQAVPPAPQATPSAGDVPQTSAGPPCASCDDGHVVDGWCDSCGAKAPDPRDHSEHDLGLVAAVSDIGQRYRRNEDAAAIAIGDDGLIVAVVCDGVGSTVDPHLASQAGVEAAREHLFTNPEDLVGAAAAAREGAASVPAAQRVASDPPSATFLAATVHHDVLRVGSLGDCRAYLLPVDAVPRIVTKDDSMEHELVAAGVDPEVAARHPQANVITRWLGRDADESWTPNLVEIPIAGAARLVLCSDGLWRYITSPEHMAELAIGGAPIEVAQRLVEFANASGGADNITAVVLDIHGTGSDDADEAGRATVDPDATKTMDILPDPT